MLTLCCNLCFNFGEDLFFVASCSVAGESERFGQAYNFNPQDIQ